MSLKISVAFLAASILLADAAVSQSPDTASAPALPGAWSARSDEGGTAQDIKFVVMEPGYHLTLGPATILYRQEDRATGPFHTLATFHQMKKLEHPEGYGLLVGGQALTGKGQRYTYFLVRDDGRYLLKKRNGDTTTEISKGWTFHRAIKRGDAQGKTSNLLEIDAKADPRKVRFKVNGQTVYSADAGSMDLKGIVGIRANHRLDVHIQDFALHQ